MKKRHYFLLIITIICLIRAFPQLTHKNSGVSESSGTVGDGALKNPYQINYSGKNYNYISPVSYYLMGNGYLHSSLYNTVIESYAACEKTCPDVQFKLMECSNKSGGNMLLHRTHQNGLSIDFAVPKKNKKRNKQAKLLDQIGLWHYLLEFNSEGESTLNKNVEIDFETMGKHLIALDDAARANGLRIKKVILKIDLKDDFYATESGKEIKRRGIYFAKSLPKIVDNMHDDHYHVDFMLI